MQECWEKIDNPTLSDDEKKVYTKLTIDLKELRKTNIINKITNNADAKIRRNL